MYNGQREMYHCVDFLILLINFVLHFPHLLITLIVIMLLKRSKSTQYKNVYICQKERQTPIKNKTP